MIERASDVRASLSDRGVTGAAADVLVRLGARGRHAARVEFACALGDDWEVVAWALLDAIGVGGTAGLTGAATARHPALRGCGKGRKQATDGAAWTAAIAAAAEIRRAGRTVVLTAEETTASRDGVGTHWRLGIELRGNGPVDSGTVWSSDDIADPGPEDQPRGLARSVVAAPWIAAIAGVVLARLTGIAPDLRADVLTGVEIEADAAAWAHLYNAAHGAEDVRREAVADREREQLAAARAAGVAWAAEGPAAAHGSTSDAYDAVRESLPHYAEGIRTRAYEAFLSGACGAPEGDA